MLIRAGAYVLRLEPALYALPAMFGGDLGGAGDAGVSPPLSRTRSAWPSTSWAATCSRDWRSRWRFQALMSLRPTLQREHRCGRVAWNCALLGRPSGTIGIRRSSIWLWEPTSPLRVGLWYFVAERFHALEDRIALVLGYAGRLPIPFRASVTVLVNLVLGGLAIWFVRGWKDRRLARHCHYIGLPLSVAACTWSTFEPRAACICLSAYAILYLLGVWVFSAPQVTYLGATALAGAVYFGSTLVPGTTIAGQALLAAAIGCAYWSIRWVLGRLQVDALYRRPWLHAALVLMMVGLAAGTAGVIAKVGGVATGSITFALIAVLAILVNLEMPKPILAYVAFLSFLELMICADRYDRARARRACSRAGPASVVRRSGRARGVGSCARHHAGTELAFRVGDPSSMVWRFSHRRRPIRHCGDGGG